MARLRRRRWPARLFLALLVLVPLAVLAARFAGFQLRGNTALGATAPLDPATQSQLDAALAADRPLDRDDAVDLAMGFTAKRITFGLDKDAEYTRLFTAAFDASAKVAGSSARAYGVRSGAPMLFGKPFPGMRTHDWVRIVDPADHAQIDLDPMLYDAFLGASLARNVASDSIALPK